MLKLEKNKILIEVKCGDPVEDFLFLKKSLIRLVAAADMSEILNDEHKIVLRLIEEMELNPSQILLLESEKLSKVA